MGQNCRRAPDARSKVWHRDRERQRVLVSVVRERMVLHERVSRRSRALASGYLEPASPSSYQMMEANNPPSFWFGPEITRRVARGHSPLLTEKQVAEANSRQGLNLLVLQTGLNAEYFTRPEATAVSATAFVEGQRGYRLKETFARAESTEHLAGLLKFGTLVLGSTEAPLATLIAIQPWFRFRSPKKWTAELEIAAVVVLNLLFGIAFIRNFDLHMHAHLSLPISREQISAISIVSGVLPFVIRGGTSIVRGCLRKTETLPQLSLRGAEADSDTGTNRLDLVEMNRGRLIGNLERLVLTLVVVAGSYAALGFLVAAKGLIRSEELQEREFAEYFLVGSLCSVLVALCAGSVLR